MMTHSSASKAVENNCWMSEFNIEINKLNNDNGVDRINCIRFYGLAFFGSSKKVKNCF